VDYDCLGYHFISTLIPKVVMGWIRFGFHPIRKGKNSSRLRK
jgi:hypothetical protein